MTIKLLLPAYGRHGATVVGANGELRLVERKRPVCHGYENGCICGDCSTRATARDRELNPSTEVKVCECDKPMVSDGHCFRCGHEIARQAA